MADVISTIEESLSLTKSRITDRYEYALYLSLDLSSLCHRLLQVLLKTHLRDLLLKHILIKLTQRQKLDSRFVDELFSHVINSDKHLRRSSVTVLVGLIDYIHPSVSLNLFNVLIDSQSKLDRNRASQIAAILFDENIEQKLWESWHKYNDIPVLRVLASNSTLNSLKKRFSEIWHNEGIPFKFKNEALKKIAVSDFNSIEFLKDTYPVSYLTACVAADRDLQEEFIDDIVRKAKSLRELGYVIWCVGKLGKTELIMKFLNEAEQIERNIPKDFDEILIEQMWQ